MLHQQKRIFFEGPSGLQTGSRVCLTLAVKYHLLHKYENSGRN